MTDLSTTAGKIADLRARYQEAVVEAEAAAREKQHAKNKLTARERIELLLDQGSFVSSTSMCATARRRSGWTSHARTATRS